MNTALVLKRVENERLRQDNRWGEQNHDPHLWLSILGEEVGEANKAALEGDGVEYCRELIQVAAVAVATVECFYRLKDPIESATEKQLELLRRKGEE